MSRSVIWFRNDLRVRDNPALMAACEGPGEVVAVYLVTPGQWQRHGTAAVQLDFIRRHLACLEAELAALNIPLLLLEADSFDTLPQTLADWCRQGQIRHLFANREYLLNEMTRDTEVEATLSGQDCRCHWFDDSCLVPPGTVRNGSGKPYKVYSAFRKPWLGRVREIAGDLQGMPSARPASAVYPVSSSAGSAPLTAAGGDSGHWPAGEAAALAQLGQFCEQRLADYGELRDRPAIDGTSGLSPYLAIGVLSPRQCLARALCCCPDLLQQGTGFDWLNELGWRDFYRHVAFHFPRVCKGRAFQTVTEGISWREDPAAFTAWCDGRTGFPIVDAAMRQLNRTGWMHNRLRMIVASFLVKDLHLDWRLGEAYFMAHLIDGDFAANNGGWQWAASTGTDAAPYFRIFNPVTQSRRFDPQGHFIRRYVPELAALDNRAIHWPHDRHRDRLGDSGYPAPIVDHALARRETLAMFQQIQR